MCLQLHIDTSSHMASRELVIVRGYFIYNYIYIICTYQYRIALKFRGSKFSRIADFELFAEKFLRTAGLREKSAEVTKFLLNNFANG